MIQRWAPSSLWVAGSLLLLGFVRRNTMATQHKRTSSSGFFEDANSSSLAKGEDFFNPTPTPKERAIVYCEGNFGTPDGEIANGLVRYSIKYEVLSVIDSEKAEKDSGKVLDGKKNGIPVYRDLGTALAQAGRPPKYLIFGLSSASGVLSEAEKKVMMRALGYGINIVSELHEFLNHDPELAAACAKKGSAIQGM